MSEDSRPEPTPKVTTNVWSRFGRPARLYVKVDDVQVGYWDSAHQQAVVAGDPSDAETYRRLIETVGSGWQVKYEAERAATERAQQAAAPASRGTAVSAPAQRPAPEARPSEVPPASAARPAPRPTRQTAAAAQPEPPQAAERGRDMSLVKAGETVGEVARSKFREAPLRNAVRRLLRNRDRGDWSWSQGERGEKTVGRLLERAIEARRGWFVLHGITRNARGTDVDHLLIGPGGIFSVNTKHHEGKKVWVGEHTIKAGSASTRHLPRARDEAVAVTAALRAACRTPRSATPVIVIVGASSLRRARKSVQDVVVLEPDDVRAWLDGLDDVLGPGEVEQLYNAARWESTWLPPGGRSS